MRGILFLFFLVPTVSFATSDRREGRAFSCADLVAKNAPTKIQNRVFVTRFRGKKLEIPYQLNRQRLVKTRDVAVVISGLDKPSFEEMLLELGKGSEQAISLDLTNINSVGPFEAPTPEEDAQIVYDLLVHLGLTKTQFKKHLYIVNHSRGALVTSRLILRYHKKIRIGGVIKFNPYVGWITNYHAQVHGESLGSGLRLLQAMVGHLPAVSLATGMAASMVEDMGASMAMSAMRVFMGIHDREGTHRALREVMGIHEEDVLENIRQKLIGMEDAEIHEDFDLMKDLDIPVIIIRSDNDQLVPAAQIDSVARHYGYPVLVFLGASHYLPYEQPQASGLLIHQILENFRKNRPPVEGIDAI